MQCQQLKSLDNYKSVVDYIRQLDSKNSSNSIATEYAGNKITRKSYWEYVNKYRKYFASLGINKGDAVTICMLNSPEYEFVFMSLLENGSIASTVSKAFLNADLCRQTVERKCNTLILSVEFLPELMKNKTFEQFGDKCPLEHIIFTTSYDYMPEQYYSEFLNNFDNYKKLIDSVEQFKGVDIVYPGEVRKAVEQLSSEVLQTENIMDDVATYSNTGGTTGAPKCAVHTHRAISSLIKSHERDRFKDFTLKEHSRSLLVIPISHITSQYYSLILRRAYGATIIYNTQVFEPAVLRKVLIEENIDDVVLPFGLYYAITRQPFAEGELKINTPLCGGEPTPYHSTKDVNTKLNATGSQSLIIGTGSTEFGSGLMASYEVENRTNESGYLFPFVDAFLLDPATGEKIIEQHKRGVLYANAPWQMQGYLNDQKATDEFFNYINENNVAYGTNNDIVEIVGEHKGQPLYSMLGRASDFVMTDDGVTYYPAVKFVDGKINSPSFKKGEFMFDMRDHILNIDGIMEVQPILIPKTESSTEGYPVVNVTILLGSEPKDILKKIYQEFENVKFKPIGIKFRTHFARSLSSDKREFISLLDDRSNYYSFNGKDYICISFDDNGNMVSKTADEITIEQPPQPKVVYSNRNKSKN